jgi:hypothetical protein
MHGRLHVSMPRAAAWSGHRASDGARCGAAWAPWATASEPPYAHVPDCRAEIAAGLDVGSFVAALLWTQGPVAARWARVGAGRGASK